MTIVNILLGPRHSAKFTAPNILFETIKPAPFAIVAPFAEWIYDLVKHDCHFTLLSLVPRTGNHWKARTKCD